jgi:hypothetical protein
VLKPGGRFAVADVVVRGRIPAEVRRSMERWIGCIAGTLEEMDYVKKLANAGFDEIDVEPTRVYSSEDASAIPRRRGRQRGRDRATDRGPVHERSCTRHKARGETVTPAHRFAAELLGTALLRVDLEGAEDESRAKTRNPQGSEAKL